MARSHGKGRRISKDDRDHGFLMRRMLAAPGTPLPARKTWRIASTALNQLRTSTCVGHGWDNFLRCAPIQTSKNVDQLRWDIYRLAVGLDEWKDNDNEAKLPNGDEGLSSGTSVRAGAEAVTKLGYLNSYVWSFDAQPVVEWLQSKGPVVGGFTWYTSMDDVSPEGIVRITPTARPDGGHCFCIRGVNTTRDLVLCTNSWGDDWGKSGEFWLPIRDLERLIHEDGEACSAVQQKLASKVTLPKSMRP